MTIPTSTPISTPKPKMIPVGRCVAWNARSAAAASASVSTRTESTGRIVRNRSTTARGSAPGSTLSRMWLGAPALRLGNRPRKVWSDVTSVPSAANPPPQPLIVPTTDRVCPLASNS